MKPTTQTLLATTVALFLLLLAPGSRAADCPEASAIQEGLGKVFKLDNSKAKILAVKPSPIAGLCEVQLDLGGQIDVLYTDPTGNLFVVGQMLDTQKGKNLTQETITSLNRLTPDEMKQLDALTAFTLGKSGKTVYFATDPECPFCKKAEPGLKRLAEEGKLTVKFIFFPLPMHQNADKQAIAIICDKKGLEGLEKNYTSSNQCEEGKKRVTDALAFFQKKGLNGTPIYIFSDGTYQMGLLENDADILERADAAK